MIPILLGTGLGDLRAQAAGIGGFSTMQVPRVQDRGVPSIPKVLLRPAKKKLSTYMRKKTYQSTGESTLGKSPLIPAALNQP